MSHLSHKNWVEKYICMISRDNMHAVHLKTEIFLKYGVESVEGQSPQDKQVLNKKASIH